MRITAFDPGKTVSYAIHDTTRPWEMQVGTIDMVGSGRLLRPSPLHVAEVILNSDVVIIEEVGARPKQGVSAVFTFGLCVGTLLGAAGALGKPIELVTPQKWKTASRLSGISEDKAKAAARAYATQLYPACYEAFKPAQNHGLAEAALMARWYFLEGAGQHALDTPTAAATAPLPAPTAANTNGFRMIAFDPGRTSSYAIYDAIGGGLMRMGEVSLVGAGRLLRPSPLHMAELLTNVDTVLIEEVGTRPDQGVSAVFTFGMSVGTLFGSAGVLGKPIEVVTPQKWKKTSGLGRIEKEEAKDLAREISSKLFPECADRLRLKKNHGMAEAGLMVRWFLLDGPGKAMGLHLDRDLHQAA